MTEAIEGDPRGWCDRCEVVVEPTARPVSDAEAIAELYEARPRRDLD